MIEAETSFVLMNKNHSQNISEEKLDRFVKTVLQSTVLTDEEVKEIADSPHLRRRLQSRIAEEKARREKRWGFGWRWQWATAVTLAVLFSTGAAFWYFNSATAEIVAIRNEKFAAVLKEETKPLDMKSEIASSVPSPIVEHRVAVLKTEKTVSETKSVRTQPRARSLAKMKTARRQKTEIATEFIALSYLPTTESGQVVRVKVPRSLMVSLGVTTKVERAAELVSAEVVVGDDGAARAIRFLANE